MAYCSQCGSEFAEDSRYCVQCGYCTGVCNPIESSSNEQILIPYSDGVQNVRRCFDPNESEIPGFFGAISICFKKCFCFKGRASRSEFGYWFLFMFVVGVLMVEMASFDSGRAEDIADILEIFFIFLYIPTSAVVARRFHDIDVSGWVTLFFFTHAVFGLFPMLLCERGTPGENRFGLEPQKRRKDSSKTFIRR